MLRPTEKTVRVSMLRVTRGIDRLLRIWVYICQETHHYISNYVKVAENIIDAGVLAV